MTSGGVCRAVFDLLNLLQVRLLAEPDTEVGLLSDIDSTLRKSIILPFCPTKSHNDSPTSPLGRRWFRSFPLPTPFFPFGEGFTPPPTPSPGPGRGGAASGQSVQDGPRWLQEGLRDPKTTSKTAQYGPRCLNMASKMLQEALRTPQDGSMLPKSSPGRPRGCQNPSKT